MPKPRIIIADTDISYIIPFQLKFVEEFFQEIDLEIITDTDYFNELFSSPQQADVLVVSEELYTFSLQRHNIGNIFLMTEKQEEEQTDDLKADRIFKYTSIKEIFNQITGKSEGLNSRGNAVKKECQIILVTSACGGTGKTTVAVGICASLTKNFKRALYINADYLQSFQRILDNQTPISDAGVYAKLANASDNVYDEIKYVIRKESFSYIPPFKAAIMSLGLQYLIYEKIAMSAKKSGDYDYIIIDSDASFNEDKAQLISVADKVVIVTDQTEGSIYATNTLVANINGINSDKYIFICNDFDKDKDNAIISPGISMRFSINDYIDHIEHFDKLRSEDFAGNGAIQRTAFLVM